MGYHAGCLRCGMRDAMRRCGMRASRAAASSSSRRRARGGRGAGKRSSFQARGQIDDSQPCMAGPSAIFTFTFHIFEHIRHPAAPAASSAPHLALPRPL
jgi:hypothetical protein